MEPSGVFTRRLAAATQSGVSKSDASRDRSGKKDQVVVAQCLDMTDAIAGEERKLGLNQNPAWAPWDRDYLSAMGAGK